MTSGAAESAVRLIGDLAALDFPMHDGEDLQTRDSRIINTMMHMRDRARHVLKEIGEPRPTGVDPNIDDFSHRAAPPALPSWGRFR